MTCPCLTLVFRKLDATIPDGEVTEDAFGRRAIHYSVIQETDELTDSRLGVRRCCTITVQVQDLYFIGSEISVGIPHDDELYTKDTDFRPRFFSICNYTEEAVNSHDQNYKAVPTRGLANPTRSRISS